MMTKRAVLDMIFKRNKSSCEPNLDIELPLPDKCIKTNSKVEIDNFTFCNDEIKEEDEVSVIKDNSEIKIHNESNKPIEFRSTGDKTQLEIVLNNQSDVFKTELPSVSELEKSFGAAGINKNSIFKISTSGKIVKKVDTLLMNVGTDNMFFNPFDHHKNTYDDTIIFPKKKFIASKI